MTYKTSEPLETLGTAFFDILISPAVSRMREADMTGCYPGGWEQLQQDVTYLINEVT